jgi:SET domain-containing protein
LGYGSIYNHSHSPNADWKQNFKTNSMVYRAIKPIKKGEEILVNYNGEPDDMTPIDWSDWKSS